MSDPRGPLRTIKKVLPIARTGERRLSLSCGHVSKVNPTFAYKTGDEHHCMTCRRIALELTV